jgi:acetyltransferase-like isoleucine patch superfamily enzyme
LVTIGANAAVEFATVRAFGVDNGAMILGPVKLGNDASIGAKSVLAPYTSIPDGGHLGPVTSSYDVGKALDAKHARVNRRCLPAPNLFLQFFVQNPITFLVNGFAAIPPLLVLLCMLQYKGQRGEAFMTLSDLIEWLCDPKRIPFYIGIRVARALLSPFFYMAAAIFVKRTVIGKFEAGPRDTWSGWELLRHDLAATLFSRKKIQAVTDIIGRHYELVSVLYRFLGAKVGKRVFWPGHQPVFTGEFDLLEIGDDVVFGSRSSIFCTTVDSCERVILCAGSNVADNCVVLPGSIIGKNAVLGSNSVCPEGWYLPANSIWFGSKGCEPDCLDKGTEEIKGHGLSAKIDQSKLQFVGDETTVRPFGKAFYQGRANYYVWPLSLIIPVTLVINTFIAAFHTLPLLGALHGAAAILYGVSVKDRDYSDTRYHFSTFYTAVLFVYFFTNLIRVGLWLGIELTAKWTLIGRRQVGRYNYDTSNYAQRWEMYQLIAKIRKFNRVNFLDFFSGTPFLSTYFRLNGSIIGKDCCLYPAGADPFMPEPDLVVMGDRCVVDCASIVCHLNTRGNFELAQITMENDCTLRTRSRIQQAVYMEEGSQLVEKTLAMTGEVIEAGTVWQGGPASFWFSYDKMTSPESSTKTVPYANSDLTEDDESYDESTKLLSNSHATSYNIV